MKILFINTQRKWSEYAEQMLMLASMLKKKDHQVSIALDSRSCLNKEAWMRRLEILPIKSKNSFNPFAKMRLSKFIKNNNIAILHVFNDKAIRLNVKVIKRAKRGSLIVTHHPGFPRKLNYFVRQCYKKRPFSLITTSHSMKQSMEAKGLKYKDYYYLPEGVDLVKYKATLPFDDFYSDYSIPPEYFLIGFQKPGENLKNVKILLRTIKVICQTNPTILFLLFGESENSKILRKSIKRSALSEKILILDDKNQVPTILSAINMMIFPFNKVGYRSLILKAMAMAKPVIALSYQSVDEIIQNEQNAIILSNEAADSLAEVVIDLVNQKEKLKLLAFNAKKTVESSFDIQCIADKLEKIYMKIVNNM